MAADRRNRIARLAGGLYLCLMPLGFFSFAYVPSVVLERHDLAATCQNLLQHESLFRAGIVSHLASQVIVVFLVLALFQVFRSVHQTRAILMVVLALLCVPISFVSEIQSLGSLHLLQPHLLESADAGACSSRQTVDQMMLFLDLHRSAVLLAQIFWGLWLLPLAGLVFGSRFLPRWLSLALLVAAFGYLFDSVAHLLAPGQATIAQFTAVGELFLPMWLLVKGVDTGDS